MHVHFLDPYQHRASLVHQLDGRVKFVLAVAFILTVALTPVGAWPIYILLLALVLALGALAELGVGYVLRRSMLALPFILAAVPIIFTLSGSAAFQINIGAWELTATQPGLERFFSIAFKSWISVQAAIILAASTPFPDLLVAMRAVKIPRLLVAIIGLMWRYLFVMADEAMRVMRARAARSGRADQPGLRAGGSVSWRARVAGGMAGGVFLRAFERSDRIYMAMVSRGYSGEVRSFGLPRLKHSEWLVLCLALAVLVALLMVGILVFG
jgi:cobalt/nickel transport system permease protein